MSKKAWKGLETALHALAESFTQGRYGRGENVDAEALQNDFDQILDDWRDALEEEEDDR